MSDKLRRFLEEVRRREQHLWKVTTPTGAKDLKPVLTILRRMVEKVLERGCNHPCGECECWMLIQEMEAEIHE